MSEDPDQDSEFMYSPAQLVGMAIGVVTCITALFFVDTEKTVVIASIGGVFYCLFYLNRKNIFTIYYIVASIFIFAVEVTIVVIARLPPIHNGYIAFLPLAVLDYIVIDAIFRGVRILFRLPEWRS